MVLNTKHFEILKELKKEDELSRLANIFNQTERNIRYKIAELNENLGEEKIFIKKRKIYCLLDEEDINSLIGGLNENNYVYEQQERIDFLILETILQKDEFYINEIIEVLQISKSTFRADIKIWKNKLSKMGIKLKKYNNRYQIVYKSSDLIYYLAVFLYQYINFDEGDAKINFKTGDYFERMVSKKLKNLYFDDLKDIYQKIKKVSFSYTDETLNLLILLICVLKNRKINTDELDVLNKKVLRETKEFKILTKTFTELSEMNIYFLTDYLIRISCDEKEIFLRHKNWIEIELGVYRLIKEFEKLKKVKILKNKKIIDDILFYIKPLIYRSTKGIKLKNTVLEEVKSLYGDTFYYLKKAFQNFEKLLNIEVSDNEIGFLVPIFEIALRNKIEKEKKVIIVSSYKKNLTNFLISRLKEEFLIDVIEVISMKRIDTIKNKNADLIVTTSKNLKLDNSEYNICLVNPILSDADVRKLKKMKIPPQDKKIPINKLMNVIKRNLGDLKWNEDKLKEELLYNFPVNITEESTSHMKTEFEIPEELKVEIDVFDSKEAIEAGANILKDKKYVTRAYVNDLINKEEEELLYFFLNSETVLVYTEPKENVLKSGFSLVKLNKPLIFNNKKVENFICFAPKGDLKDQEMLFKLNDYFEKQKY